MLYVVADAQEADLVEAALDEATLARDRLDTSILVAEAELRAVAMAAEHGQILEVPELVSAPLVAVAANSPYLFGLDLWDETRIPIFEQSVASGGIANAKKGPLKRITFGNDYVRESLWECFEENLEHYPVLLPHDFEQPAEEMAHLRLHNGTIWRWNRPLIGFSGDVPHLRIEQRVIPAGPTIPIMSCRSSRHVASGR